jgi:hypothetical protein
MASQYYRNLEDFCLEKFRQRLATEEVMPAHQVLKEDLDERFQVLVTMGITNLQTFNDAQGLSSVMPSLKDAAHSVAEAQELPHVVQYT